MLIRLVVVILIFASCYYSAGSSGLYAALLLSGLYAAIVGPPKQTAQEQGLAVHEAQERLYERVEHAKKGRAADPTRPGYGTDDHPLLLTNEFRRVR